MERRRRTEGRRPYDGFANLLLYLERLVGGVDVFLPYVRDYFKTYAGTSISARQWQDHLLAYFGADSETSAKLKTVDWNSWLHGTATSLPVENEYDTSLADAAYALARRWTNATDHSGYSTADLKGLSSAQQIVMLETLLKTDFDAVDDLTAAYDYDRSPDAEIRISWYRVALRHSAKYAQSAADWVLDKGRLRVSTTV